MSFFECFVFLFFSLPLLMADSLNVGSFNVRGMKDKTKRRAVYDFLESKRILICFLQEVH